MTLIELIVGMTVFGMLSLVILNIFQATNDTAITVQKGSYGLATTQTATQTIAKEIRNARGFSVVSSGSRLDIEQADGTCITWVKNGPTLYTKSAGTTYPYFATSWGKALEEASVVPGIPFFAKTGNSLTYTFKLGSGAGAVSVKGTSFVRLPVDRTTSPCFSPS
jgi:type II secretory pathway pseudopilin PulG